MCSFIGPFGRRTERAMPIRKVSECRSMFLSRHILVLVTELHEVSRSPVGTMSSCGPRSSPDRPNKQQWRYTYMQPVACMSAKIRRDGFGGQQRNQSTFGHLFFGSPMAMCLMTFLSCKFALHGMHLCPVGNQLMYCTRDHDIRVDQYQYVEASLFWKPLFMEIPSRFS